MTLENAIDYLTELLEKNDFPCEKCADEHNQLKDWLVQLKEYKDMEAQHRLYILPCVPGTTIYFIENYRGCLYEKPQMTYLIGLQVVETPKGLISTGYFQHGTWPPFLIEQNLGKSLFLSQEEAKKAIEERIKQGEAYIGLDGAIHRE